MALCGIPIFVLEVAVGQYLGEGGMTLVGRLCPLLGGTGVATMVLVSLLNIYYCGEIKKKYIFWVKFNICMKSSWAGPYFT